MGEAVLKDIAKKRGLDIVVDSCGTASYHVGESPDERYVFSSYFILYIKIFTTCRTIAVCKKVQQSICILFLIGFKRLTIERCADR